MMYETNKEATQELINESENFINDMMKQADVSLFEMSEKDIVAWSGMMKLWKISKEVMMKQAETLDMMGRTLSAMDDRFKELRSDIVSVDMSVKDLKREVEKKNNK